jgi:hypothetical protein
MPVHSAKAPLQSGTSLVGLAFARGRLARAKLTWKRNM